MSNNKNKIQQIFTNHYSKVMDFSCCVTGEMNQAALNIIKCRTPLMKIHFEECPLGCGFYVLYDSCKHRGCPQCQTLENNKWLHIKKQLLLPGSHVHQVFKLPVSLFKLWLFNKRKIANCMFSSVKKSFAKYRKKDRLERGIHLVFHSSGKGLSYHPHIHCLVTGGGFTKERQWVEKSFAYSKIENTYREELKKELINLVKSEGFYNPSGMDCIKEILTLKDKEWRIFQSEVYKTGEGVLAYLSKSIKSGPITEKDILDFNDKEVILQYGEGKEKEIIKLKVEDFIIRYLNHIPPKQFMIVRNLGLYSSRKVNSTKAYKKELGIEIDERKYEIPKRVCPDCGKQVVPVVGMGKKKLKEYCLGKCA